MSPSAGSSQLLARVCGLMAAGWLLLTPLAVAPWFHTEFAAAKQLIVAALGIPTAVLLLWQQRRQPMLSSLHVMTVWLVAAALFLRIEPEPTVSLSGEWLVLLAAPLIALQIGATTGGLPGALRQLARTLGIAATLVLLTGLVRRNTELLAWIPDRADVAFSATLGNSNALAEFSLPVALLLLLLPGGRWFDTALAFVALSLSALSESRAAMVAGVIGLCIGSILLVRDGMRRRGWLLLSGLGAAALLLAVLPQAAALRERAASVFDPAHPTNSVRLELWSSTLRLSHASPPVGAGAGRFEAAIAPWRSAEEWARSGPNTRIESPHNEFLWILAEMGYPGAILALILIVLVIRRWRSLGSHPARAALAAVFISTLVFALVRSPLHHPCGTLSAALCLGWLWAATPTSSSSRSRWPGMVVMFLLIIIAMISMALVRTDWLVGRARRQLVAYDHHLRHQAPLEAMQALADCADTVAELGSTRRSPDHAWRAALVARELAVADRAYSDLGTPQPWLAHATESTARLISMCRRDDDLHLPARLLAAEELLRVRETDLRPKALAEAEALLRDTLEKLPAAPSVRPLLAELLESCDRPLEAMPLLREELVHATATKPALLLHLGTLELQHGGRHPDALSWLQPRAARPDPELDLAREADLNPSAGPALEHALRVLALQPCHQEALDLVVRNGFALRHEEGRALANRATARAKLALAVQAVASGDAATAQINLRLAISRDPQLAPAHLLAARCALERGDSAAANASLTTLRTLQIEGAQIRTALESDPVLAAALRSGTLDAALR